jgi:hypothetical protein
MTGDAGNVPRFTGRYDPDEINPASQACGRLAVDVGRSNGQCQHEIRYRSKPTNVARTLPTLAARRNDGAGPDRSDPIWIRPLSAYIVRVFSGARSRKISIPFDCQTGLAGTVRLVDRGNSQILRSKRWGLSTAASEPFPTRRKAKQSLFRAKNCLFDEIYSLFHFAGNLLVTL